MAISLARAGFGRALTSTALVLVFWGAAACGAPYARHGGAPPATPVHTGTWASSGTDGQHAVPVESLPPGDIPDNLAFVSYTNDAGHYTVTHPEGWAQTGGGTQAQFTDKLNGLSIDSVAATAAPTVDSAKTSDVTHLASTQPAFELRDIQPATVPAGDGVVIIFRRNSAPDAVTGKVHRDEVQEYLIFHAGRLVTMDLYGPVGADNVDAYRTMSQSLVIR